MFYFNDNSNIMFGNDGLNERFCENCSTPLTDILSSGVVGCHNCYMFFRIIYFRNCTCDYNDDIIVYIK